MKKLFALMLAAVMVFACIGAVSAAEIADLDCSGWWTAHTEGVEVTEKGVTITFTNTTYASAENNWNGPLWVLFSSDDATVSTATYAAPNYAEYWVERADIFGWAGTAGDADATTTGNCLTPAWGSWENFLAALKAGTSCEVTAVRKANYVTVTMEIAGAISTVTTPVAADKPAYIALTGELTKLTNIKVTEGVDNSVQSSVDCSGWWTAFADGVEITTKGVQITFTNTTYASAANNWDAALYVLYSGDMNKIGTFNYTEYWIQRSDNYGWVGTANTGDTASLEAAGITYTSDYTAYIWENHLSDLKSGVSYTITAVREGDKVTVTMSGNGGSNTVTVPVTAGAPVYLSLGGENTKLTNIKSGAISNSGSSGTNENAPAKTGDVGLALPILVMAVSAVAVVTMKKKLNV